MSWVSKRAGDHSNSLDTTDHSLAQRNWNEYVAKCDVHAWFALYHQADLSAKSATKNACASGSAQLATASDWTEGDHDTIPG